MCVCVCVPWHLDAVLVAVDGAPGAGALLLGEDDDVLVEEDVPHARPLPPSSPAHRQLAVPHQLAALRHGDLKVARAHTRTHPHIRMHLSWPQAQALGLHLQR